MKLAVIGDLHYHLADEAVPEWLEARNAFYGSLLGRFCQAEADLYISLGDLTNLGLPRELREVYRFLEPRATTFYHVLGNHDLYSQPRREVLALTGQPRYHSICTDRAVLAFLDTNREMDRENWSGWMDNEQLQWLEHVVAESGTTPLLVFAHHPVYGTTEGSTREKAAIDPDIDIWGILSRKKGTGIYFNGHVHLNSVVGRQNWHFVQLAAGLDYPGFTMVEVLEEEIRISSVDGEEPGILDHASSIYKHIRHFAHNPEARNIQASGEVAIPLLRAAAKP